MRTMHKLHWLSFCTIVPMCVYGLHTAATPPPTAYAATPIIVTSIADAGGVCPSRSDCTLRTAIEQANATPGKDTIAFMIAIPTPEPYAKIWVESALPPITDPVIIDGWTQPTGDGKHVPLINLRGVYNSGISGLTLAEGSDGSTIRGLIINQFSPHAIAVTSSGNQIAGNYLGTDATGSAALANAGAGIFVEGPAEKNIIGTNGDGIDDESEQNIISGNDGCGIYLGGSGSNIVAGNTIGLDATGEKPIPNDGPGIIVQSSHNRIGTDGDSISDAAEQNTISANLGNEKLACNAANQPGAGILLSTNAEYNTIAGNIIGLNRAGTKPQPNETNGIEIYGSNNTIGVSYDSGNVSQRNIIASNYSNNIEAFDAHNTIISGNYIGVLADGDTSLQSHTSGITIYGGFGTIIGTDGDNTKDVDERNIISGNTSGVFLQDTSDTTISGNYIGISASGQPLGNSYGIHAIQSKRTTIGTNSDGSINDREEGNVISSNKEYGIYMYLSPEYIISGNLIGTGPSGETSHQFGNLGSGIDLYGSPESISVNSPSYIGAHTNADTNEPNIIGNNGKYGISMSGIDNLVIAHNHIGSDPDNNPIGNGAGGLRIESSRSYNFSSIQIRYNALAFNKGAGIDVSGISPQVFSNNIYENDAQGIKLSDTAYPVIGSPSQPNTIYDNCVEVSAYCANIYTNDSNPQNKTTLTEDNHLSSQNNMPQIEQHWKGTAEVISHGTPIATKVTLVSPNGGPTYQLQNAMSCPWLNTILHTSAPISTGCESTIMWTDFTEYIVKADGTRVSYMPLTAAAPLTGTYSFDGDASTHPADSGFGFVGEGISFGETSIFQVMEVRDGTDLPTPTATSAPTATSTPTATSAPTATSTPQPTPETTKEHHVFIPFILNAHS